jgi:acetoin utilization deacetylase AcuC-like enzyme
MEDWSLIPTYFAAAHVYHAPKIEFQHGRFVPYYESPRRVDALLDALEDASLIHCIEPASDLPRHVLAQVHDPVMLSLFEATSADARQLVQDDLASYGMHEPLPDNEDVYYYPSIFVKPEKSQRDSTRLGAYMTDSSSPVGIHTWEAALASAAMAYAGAQALLQGEKQAYALCRPPGHHAGYDFMGGYCYLNNAAIAATALKARGKVALLDIDYHHGNGTQAIFWDDPDVLFASLHIEPAIDYPYYSGAETEIGGEQAQQSTLNLPLPVGTDERAYITALDHALERIAAFEPGALVISLGFDTYKDDPIATFTLDTTSYTTIGQHIAALNLPTLYVQEGGYRLDAIGPCAAHFFQGVLGA